MPDSVKRGIGQCFLSKNGFQICFRRGRGGDAVGLLEQRDYVGGQERGQGGAQADILDA